MTKMNEVIKLGKKPYDVCDLPRQRRILYFPKEKSIIIKCDHVAAKYDNLANHNDEGVILTPRTATILHPQVFCNSKAEINNNESHTIVMKVNNEQYLFCQQQQGNISKYLRELINREMAAHKPTKP